MPVRRLLPLIFACCLLGSYALRLGNYFSFSSLVTPVFAALFYLSWVFAAVSGKWNQYISLKLVDAYCTLFSFLSLIAALIHGPNIAKVSYLGQIFAFGVLPYFCLRTLVISKQQLESLPLISTLIILAATIFAFSLLSVDVLFFRSRLGGDAINPNGLAVTLLPLSLISLSGYSAGKVGVSNRVNLFGAFVGAVGIFATGSRSAISAWVLAVAMLLLLRNRGYAAMFLIFVAVAFVYMLDLLSNQQEFTRLYDFYGGSILLRFEFLSTSWALIRNSPFLGYGVYGFQEVTGGDYPHNVYLEIIVSFGVPLGMLCVTLLLLAAAELYRELLRDRCQLVQGLIVAILACLWVKLFATNMGMQKDIFILTGILYAHLETRKRVSEVF